MSSVVCYSDLAVAFAAASRGLSAQGRGSATDAPCQARRCAALLARPRPGAERRRGAAASAIAAMSDIGITIPWYVIVVGVAGMGWPGLLIGAGSGALLSRRHRIIGGLGGAVALDLACA